MSSHSKMILLMIHYPRAHKMWSLDQQYQHHVGTRWKYKLSCPTLESESETMRVGSSFPTLTNHSYSNAPKIWETMHNTILQNWYYCG